MPTHEWSQLLEFRRVHEQILPALRRLGGSVRFTDIVVEHTGYLDSALRRRKLERDLRLLHLENAEKPDEPFVLFNLGHVCHELGQVREALGMFQRSLARSQTVDSIVRKLYALIAQCHRTLGEHAQALAVCKAGREYYPDDCELLFQQGLAVLAHGDLARAERSFLQLIHQHEGAHFGSLDTGLKGYKVRHNLAAIYMEQGRLAEAEAQWRAALAEHPGFAPALMGLEHLGRQRAIAS